MAARAMLLMLAVGVFMAIWSEDRDRPKESRAAFPTKSRAASHTRFKTASRRGVAGVGAQRSPQTLPTLGAPAGRPQPPRGLEAASTRTASVPKRSIASPPTDSSTGAERENFVGWFTADLQFPLPVGITPGEFRVVCSDGQVWHLMLTPQLLQERGIDPAGPLRNLHEVSDGSLRWYFVRVGMPPEVTIAEAAADSRLAVAARKPTSIDWSLPQWATRLGTTLGGLRVAVSQSARRMRHSIHRRVRDSIRRWALAALDVRRMFGRRASRLTAEPKDARR